MKKWIILTYLVSACLLLGGCTKAQLAAELPLPADFTLPQKQIYSLGEATHGSGEFTLARQNVFEYLVKERGVRAFCLEADFGEGQTINGLLYGDTWNAREVTRQFAFWIYEHEEMKNLLQWMRDWNSAAAPEDQVRFYGFDCQHWDKSRAWLLAYLKETAPEEAKRLETSPLSAVSERAMRLKYTGALTPCVEAMAALLADMQAQRAAYLSGGSERDYDIALRTAGSMLQSLHLNEINREVGDIFSKDISEEEAARKTEQILIANNMRDACMAEQVAWILEHEKKHFNRDAVFVTGHNGHITKENYAEEHVRLGEWLFERYGKEYYAIGTDFGSGWFKAVDMSGRGSIRAFQLGDGPLAAHFGAIDAPVAFVDFAAMQEKDRAFFTASKQMHTIGAVFNKEMQSVPEAYLWEATPAECYDALLYFPKVHAFHSTY